MRYRNILLSLFFLIGSALPCRVAVAQEITPDKVVTMKAEVIEITKQESSKIPGTDVPSINRTRACGTNHHAHRNVYTGREKIAFIPLS